MSPESLAPPHPLPPAAAPAVWPRQWPQREGLLERQHDRLEGVTGAAKAAEKVPAQIRVVKPAMASLAVRGFVIELATAT